MNAIRWLTVAALTLVAAAVPHAAAAAPTRVEPAAVTAAAPRDARVIVAWNRLAYDVGYGEDEFRTFKALRAFTLMHLAMHDALNAVDPVYHAYAFEARERDAQPVVAAAQAAHDVLQALYPGTAARLEAELAAWLAGVPDGPARANGVALGRRAAAAVLAARAGDGWDHAGTYAFGERPGDYRTTPPWDGFVLQPGFRHAKPFGFDRADRFRPAPPPPLGSAAYAAAYDEVMRFGAKESRARSADQTAYALWWMEFAEGSVNRLACGLVAAHDVPLMRAARAFALLNMSLYDGYIATWDSKYEFNHWRPHTAIHAAAGDGNAATAPDPRWAPLRPTPPFPEYVSAHAVGAAASFEILARTLGDTVSFEMDSRTAPPGMPARRFAGFRAAAAECADSRVRLGWHFRYATDAGLVMGRAVASYEEAHHLTPR